MAPNCEVVSGVSVQVPAGDSFATEPAGSAKSEPDVVRPHASPVIALVLPPLDEMDPTVSFTLFKSKVPEFVIDTADKSGTEPEPDSLRVPASIVVVLV